LFLETHDVFYISVIITWLEGNDSHKRLEKIDAKLT